MSSNVDVKSGIKTEVFKEIKDLAFSGGEASAFILDVSEETSTLLRFDIVDLLKPLQPELLESIQREGVVIYEKK